MRRVQIHYESANGNKGVINYLSGENAELSSQPAGSSKEKALIDKAHRMIASWRAVFPDDQFHVVVLR